ncbi:MAG: GIY-YIG nuclease family protein [Patescibacteria group bacterium]
MVPEVRILSSPPFDSLRSLMVSDHLGRRSESNVLSQSKDRYMSAQYFLYILECRDGSYYVGSTNDLIARVDRHNAGAGADWTNDRRPVKLVYQETYDSMLSARKRERQLKGWSRYKKENLINGIWKKL